ncbi:hypothetical protein SUGI_1124280 [Cryptomeria japonica]|nr:hypothetical protein SUGI_1124280 [Cryptomeria japonica]
MVKCFRILLQTILAIAKLLDADPQNIISDAAETDLPNIANVVGETALFKAVELGHEKIVAELLPFNTSTTLLEDRWPNACALCGAKKCSRSSSLLRWTFLNKLIIYAEHP